MRFFNLRPPVRLGTRIAAMTLLALLAVQALIGALFFLLPPPQMPVYSAKWLSDKIERIVPVIFAAPVQDRAAVAWREGEQYSLMVRWQAFDDGMTRRPVADVHPGLERVRLSLENSLREKTRSVTAYEHHHGPPRFGIGFGPGSPRSPPEEERGANAQNQLTCFKSDEQDHPIFSHFEFAIEGLDGSWLFIEPQWRRNLPSFVNPLVITTIAAVLIVSVLSAFTATRSLQPLNRLVEAAERLGRTREAAPIDTTGLNEFSIIADAMNGMQFRLRQFIDERTQMLAAISHDLRTSLTRLRLEAEELPDSETKERLIADVNEMEQMIAATLTFAGDDLKKEPHQQIDLAALLISLCDSALDHGQDVGYLGPNHTYLRCQPIAMKRAFANLIGNAIKYGERAGVALTIEKGVGLVTIRDSGPGIPPDKVEIAFRPFRRLEESRNRESGGVGLGLTIARDIIRAHGGEISMQNRAEGGLEVLVRLPQVFAA